MPKPEGVWQVIGDVCETMLEGSISNIGGSGIRKVA